MTAEIAILNKSAAALAADSAVTIGGGNSAKIYDTVNKIFEVSNKQPISLMIYGGLEFMGLPFEVIAKYYRITRGNNNIFSTVEDCAADFLDFLENDINYGDREIKNNIGGIVFEIIRDLALEIDNEIWRDILSRGRFLPSKQNPIAQDVIKRKIDGTRDARGLKNIRPSYPFRPGHLSGIIEGREQFVLEIADRILKTTIAKRTQETNNQIFRLIRYKLHRNEFSPNRTGIVFCGYGEDELCPSLEEHEIDGIIDGRLKRQKRKTINIGRESVGADVVAFAQDEMVARFLMGIDPRYEKYIMELGSDTLRKFANSVISVLRANTAANIPDDLFDDTISRLMADIYYKTEEKSGMTIETRF